MLPPRISFLMTDLKLDPKPLATPEGDNEHLPDVPLTPDSPTPERPRGNEPHTQLPLRSALDPTPTPKP